jgi:hypothetical protein
MQNVRVTGLGRFPPRFQRKVWKAKYCVSGSLQEAPKRIVYEVGRMKVKMQWRPQGVRDVKNMPAYCCRQ